MESLTGGGVFDGDGDGCPLRSAKDEGGERVGDVGGWVPEVGVEAEFVGGDV